MNRVADSLNPRHEWRPALLVTVAVIVAVQASPNAQTSGPAVTVTPNVNVLRNVSDPLLGDANLQRQTEPVVAISTRNPDHIMIAANDYRTVDISSDQGIGQVFAQTIRTVSRTVEKLWARITGRSEPPGEAEEEERERAEAGTEAWIGVYITNDRGRNWTNAWMPGYPQDSSAAGKSSPAYGRQAASDPVLVAAPAGRFYLGAMAFDRGGASKIVVSRFTDRNNSERGNNFHFDLMRAVDEGSSSRQFLDKPSIAADIARTVADAGACGPVYIGYTVFDAKALDPTDRSKIYVATSLDCGNTWLAPRKVNRQSKLVQGVTLAVRPSDGRLYAVYRDFEANRMYLTWADDRGYTFVPPVDVSGPMLAFDQPSLGAPDYAFRSNAFPTMAVTGDNAVYVAWQERLAANGNPRIVVTSSINGSPWAAKKAVEADRCIKNASGTTTCGVPAGPQVMPSLTSSRGHVMLAFYEARPGIDDVKFVASQNASYITGLDAQLYLRVAQLDATGKGVSAIATQYEVDKDGKPLPLIAKDGTTEYRAANRANLPMYGGGKFAFIGDYISIAPSMPFVRATPDATTAASSTATNSLGFFKKDATTSGKKDLTPYWRWATEPNDGPTASFQAAWTDNRDVIFPLNAAGVPRLNGNWTLYGPPGSGPCINPGSRNANVYTAEIAPRLVAGSPTTFKQFGIQRAFVVYLQNRTGDRKFFRMTIVDTPEANASFVQRGADQNVRDVEIFPLSTVTDTVYVNGGNANSQPVRVQIAEIDKQGGVLVPGGDTATVVFNGDNSNPPLETSAPTSETHTPKLFTPGNPHSSLPRISNPQLANPQLANPQLANPQLANPQLANPQLANLQLTNSPYADPNGDVVRNVTNYTWQVTNAGSTASAFTPVFNIANQAALAGKKTRIVIHNTYRTPAFIQTPNGCRAIEQPRDVIVSIIESPQLANPQLANPQLANPQLANPQLANSTFYVAPSDPTASAAGTAASAARNQLQNVAFQVPGAGDSDLTINIPPPDTFITLSIQDGETFQTGPPPPPPAPGEPPPPSNPPLTLDDFKDGGSALGVVSSAAPVINGVVQPIVESVSTSADLVFATNPTVTPLSLAAGGLVTISPFNVTVVGNTSTAAGGFRYGFYLSTTVEINPTTAVFLGSLTHVGAIAPAATVTLAGGTFAIPPSTTPGSYYVGVFLNDGQIYTPPLTPYIFESFANDTVSLPLTIAAPVGPAPTSASDTGLTGEDVTLNVAVPGVLANDGNSVPVTAVLSLGASHGTVTLNTNGSYTYVPAANYFGPDSFTYYASNGTLASPLTTVSITVSPVNDAPGFVKGPDQTVPADEVVSVPGWATSISAGPSNESGQTLDFIVTADSPGLFATPPTISPSGLLAFKAGHVAGSTVVHVTLHDNGGTEPGVNVSATQSFNVTVLPPPGPSADLRVTQVRAPASPTVGSSITYTVTVTNLGPDSADAVRVTDTYPDGLTLLSAVPSVGTCGTGDLGNVCNLGTLGSLASATIVIQYTAVSAKPVNHTVVVSSTASDPVPANNTATDASMVVYPPCGAATFQGPNLFPLAGLSAGVVAVGDFNHDTRPDLAITVSGTDQIAIVLAGPPIPSYINVGTTPTSIVSGDFNNDGNVDLAVVNSGSSNVGVLLGDGAGGFAAPVNYPVPTAPFSNAVGDFNGDGNLDMAIGYVATTATSVAVLLGDGAGHFSAATTYPSGVSPTNVLVADYDGDGKLDIAVPNTGAGTIAILRGDGSGGFAAPLFVSIPGPGPVARLRDLGDVNKDGRPDLGVTTGTGTALNLMLLLNAGGGTFAAPVEIIGPIGIQFVVPGDFNGDGNPDLAANNFAAQRLLVLLGDGAGHFAESASYAIGGANYLVALDVNDDGRLDIVGTPTGAFFVLFNECSNSVSSDLTVVATAPPTVANGATFSYTVAVTNSGPEVANTVVMTSAYPSGTTFVSATAPTGTCSDLNGVVSCHESSIGVGATVSFTVTLKAFAAGVRTVNASATSLSADTNPTGNYTTASTTVGVGSSTFVVTTTADSGPGSLRQAILNSNLNAGSTNRINFNISTASPPYVIAVTSQLPAATVPVVIDGTTQPGFAGTPIIQLDGAVTATPGNGLVLNGGGNTVKGLSIEHFGANGIVINSPNNTIGGTLSGEGNAIANNSGRGINVNSGTANAIRRNAIFSNGNIGIDLGANGVTANDAGDVDTGPNNLQNFPVLTKTQIVGGVTTIAGTLNSAAGTSFGIDLFSNSACDASGNGEGRLYLGSLTATTDGSGNASFSTTSFSVPLGDFITATATDPSGNTSEFSACRKVVTGLIVTDLDAGFVTSGDQSAGFAGLDARHDGGPVPEVLASVALSPAGKPNLSFPGLMALLPASADEPGIGYFQATGAIGIFDIASGLVVDSVESPTTPQTLRANSTTRFVYFTGGNQLLAIDGRSGSPTYNEIVLRMTIGFQMETLAIDETRGRLYVFNNASGTTTVPFSQQLVVIDADPASGTFHEIIGGAQLPNFGMNVGSPAVVNTAANKIYYVDSFGLRVINGTTLAVTAITGSGLNTSFAVNPSKNTVYSGNGFNVVTAINGATDTVVTTIALPTAGGPAAGGDGRLVIHNASGRVFYRYDDGPQSSRLAVIDGDPASPTFNTVLAQMPAGWETSQSFMAVDQAAGVYPGRVVFHTNGTRTTTIIDALSNAVIATVPAPQGSTRPIAIDPVSHTAHLPLSVGAVQSIDLISGATKTVHTGTEVRAPVLDATGHVAYVPRTGVDTGLAVVDSSGLLTTIKTPSGAGEFRFAERNGATNRIYAANFIADVTGNLDASPGSVSVIDGSTRTVVATVAVGNRPTGIAIDEVLNKIYVGNTAVLNDVSANYHAWAGISIIDGATNAVTPANLDGIAATALNIQQPLVVNPTTGRVYFRIAAGASTTLGVFNPATNTATALPASFGPVSVIKVNPVLNKIYVGATNGRVHVLDGTTHAELANLAIGSTTNTGSLQNWIAVNRTTGRVYVADQANDALHIIDGSTNAILKTIHNAERPLTLAVSEARNRVYMPRGGGEGIMIIDGATMKVVGGIGTPLQHAVAIAVDDTITPTQLYVTADCSSGSTCFNDPGVMVISDPVDPNGSITMSSITSAGHGTAVLNPDGSLQYTSTPGYAGPDSFTFTMTDANGASATGTITLTVLAPIVVTPATLPSTSVGAPYTQTFTASGGTAPYFWFVDAGQLPPGLVLNQTTGVLSGSTVASGTYSVTIEADDSIGNGGSQTYTIVVGPPVIVTGLISPTINVAFSQQLFAGGNTGAVTWSLNKQNSPLLDWLSLSSSGMLSGTAPSYGVTPQFIVTATDAIGQTATRTYTLNVIGPLEVVPTTLREGVVLETGQPALPIFGGTGVRTATVVSGSLPPGVTMNANGTFTGAPTNHGTFTFDVQVQDSATPPVVITRTINWRVSAREQQGGTGATTTIAFGGAGGRRLAQTFTVGASGRLTGVGSFNLTCSLLGPVTVAIQRLTPSGLPDGATIASGTATANFSAMTVSPALNVAVDEKLAFVLSSPTPCTISSAPSTDSYQAGEAFADSGSGWVTLLATADARYDIPFRTLVQPVVPLGYLITARGNSTRAVALASGSILFTGTNNSAEIYNPATKLSTATAGNMTVARNSHTATLLATGKVLIAGGRDSFNNFLSSAEIFDPATGLFTATGSMATARSDMTATLLPSGKVLIAGGNTLLGPIGVGLASTELYDPVAGTFSPGPTMSSARWVHTATVLTSGKILMAGGFISSGSQSAELYDPILNTFSPTLGPMEQSRGQHRAILLADGRVLIVGGQAGDIQPTAEIYDPLALTAANAFTFTGSMSTPRQQPAVAILSDGSVLVAGGLAEAGVSSYTLPLATVERWSPSTGTFVKAGSMVARRLAPQSFTTGVDTILWAGGGSQSWLTTNSIESFSPASTPHLDTTTLPDGSVGAAYGPVTLAASGGSGAPYTINRISGALPPGVNYAGNTLSGTPTAAGVYTLGFEVVDGSSQRNQQSLALRVGSLAITSPYRLVDGALTQPYSLALTATAPATWSVPQGSSTPPPGLTVSPSGLISGIPTALGYYNFFVRAVDSSGLVAQKTVSINIVNKLTITTSTVPEAVLWDSYNRCIQTTGWIGTRTFTVTGGALPPGLALNSATGCITGTVSGTGPANPTIQVTDTASPPQAASVTLPWRASAPDLSYNVSGINDQPIGQTSSRSVARTFTVGVAGTLIGAQAWGLSSCATSPAVQLTARLYRASPTTGEPSGLLASGTGDWFDPIKFGASVLVGQGEQYVVEFQIPSGDCTIATPPTVTWMPGDAWQKVGVGAWERMVGLDVPFRTLLVPMQSFSSLSQWRGGVAAALTSGGRILMTGGNTNSADVYDPALNTTVATANMAISRTFHTATSLGASGKVLITGGQDNSGVATATAVVFDPAGGGSFLATANNMSAARSQHTATLLADGRVLIAGGANGGVGTASVDIYNPTTNAFTPVASMSKGRWSHSATLLPGDTRVLVVGGNSNGPFPVSNGEVYDPALNTWTPTSEPIRALRSRHATLNLADGRVMIVGGSRFYPAPEPVTEIYDKATNRLTDGPSLLVPRMDPVVVNNLVLGGSASDAFGQDGLSEVERYNTATGTFEYAGNLMVKRRAHAAFSIPGGKVAVLGGYNASVLAGRTLEIFGPDPAPVLRPGMAPDAQVGAAYGPFTFNIAGSAPFSLFFLSGAVADGVSFTPNLSGSSSLGFDLSGVPTAAGTFPFNVFVTDSLGQQRPQPYRVRVDPVIITTTRLPDGSIGVGYSQSIGATSLHGPLTFKIISNTGTEVSSGSGLAPGLTLSSGGVVSGTPTASGFFTFNVRVRDSLGQSVVAIVAVFIS